MKFKRHFRVDPIHIAGYIVLGIGAGAASFASFAKRMARHARETQKRPPDRP